MEFIAVYLFLCLLDLIFCFGGRSSSKINPKNYESKIVKCSGYYKIQLLVPMIVIPFFRMWVDYELDENLIQDTGDAQKPKEKFRLQMFNSYVEARQYIDSFSQKSPKKIIKYY